MKKNILYILMAVLILLNFKTIYDVNNINRQVNIINHSVLSLNGNIMNIQSNISNTIQRMYEEKKWLYNTYYSVTNLSEDLRQVDVEFGWSIRELDKGYRVYLLYGVQDEKGGQVTKWNEATAEDLGNLNYKLSLKLPYQNNYQFKVLAKNDKNTISEKLTEIGFLNRLNDRINIEAMPRTKASSNNHVNMEFSVNVSNMVQMYLENYKTNIDENILRMKNIDIKIYSSGILKKEISILKDGNLVDSNAKFDEPFRVEKDMRLERLSYSSNVQYDTEDNSYEEIEVIVEDYMGKTYNKISFPAIVKGREGDFLLGPNL